MYLTSSTCLYTDRVLLTTCMMYFMSCMCASVLKLVNPILLLSSPSWVNISETSGSHWGLASRYPSGFYMGAYVLHVDMYKCISCLLVLHAHTCVQGACGMLLIFLLTDPSKWRQQNHPPHKILQISQMSH